jgi:hypothetical protein
MWNVTQEMGRIYVLVDYLTFLSLAEATHSLGDGMLLMNNKRNTE